MGTRTVSLGTSPRTHPGYTTDLEQRLRTSAPLAGMLRTGASTSTSRTVNQCKPDFPLSALSALSGGIPVLTLSALLRSSGPRIVTLFTVLTVREETE